MQFSLTRTVAPSALPVSLTDMKDHLRVDTDVDDDYITALSTVAADRVETVTGRSLCSQQWLLVLDSFPRVIWRDRMQFDLRHHRPMIYLPKCPVVSVDSITYIDPTGAQQSIAPNASQTDLYSEPSRLLPPLGTIWPQTSRDALNAVMIRFTTGYATGAIPTQLVQAQKLMVGSWYANREDIVVGAGNVQTIPRAAESLMQTFKVAPLGYQPTSAL